MANNPQATPLHWWCSGSGLIELELTAQQVRTGYHRGACDADVAALAQDAHVARQLATIDPDTLRAELAEWGAWDAAELADHGANLHRVLWLACGDLAEQLAD